LDIQLLHEVRSELNSELLLGSAMPRATISVLFAQKYGNAEPAIASTVLVSTVGMIAALRPSRLGMHFFIQRICL
jgi:predicted permease